MLNRIIEQSHRMRERIAWLGPLLVRLVVGWTFATTGWGKLHHLDQVTQFFTQLGIPAAGFQAHLVGTVEFVGGVLILLGALTRWAALPLAVVMVVAIATAKWSSLHGFTDLVGTEEATYLAVFVWLAVAGAGPASIDHLWTRRRSAPVPTE